MQGFSLFKPHPAAEELYDEGSGSSAAQVRVADGESGVLEFRIDDIGEVAGTVFPPFTDLTARLIADRQVFSGIDIIIPDPVDEFPGHGAGGGVLMRPIPVLLHIVEFLQSRLIQLLIDLQFLIVVGLPHGVGAAVEVSLGNRVFGIRGLLESDRTDEDDEEQGYPDPIDVEKPLGKPLNVGVLEKRLYHFFWFRWFPSLYQKIDFFAIQMRKFIIVPVYNEGKVFAAWLPKLLNIAKELNAEVVVVDDGSEEWSVVGGQSPILHRLPTTDSLDIK